MRELTLIGVTKTFGAFTAVRDVSLTIRPDEVVCLLGPSGCGKTTTLRMLAGLEETTAGRILFGEEDVTDLPARDRNVAMAFQFYALYPDLNVAENLVFPLKAEGLTPVEIEEKRRRIAAILQLEEVQDRYPHQLSEGEKQRVAVGRCVIRSPNAFLFDEPLSRLDAKLRDEMRGSIKEILSGLDRPTVIVTHDQLEAMTMGDRIVVMRAGMIEQIGAPQEVFDRPNNLFVAGFIGTPQMSLLEGVALPAPQGEVALRLGEADVRIKADLLRRPAPGEALTLGFRPRAVRLGGGGEVVFAEAQVSLLENMGAETLVHAEWRGQSLRMLAEGPGPEEGGLQDFSLSAEDLSFFDAEGSRIPRKEEQPHG